MPGPRRRLPRLSGRVVALSIAGFVLAVFVGLQLGNSAVSAIDPAYFRAAAVHPRDRGAAVDPNAPRRPGGNRYAEAYGWDEGRAALAADGGEASRIALADPDFARLRQGVERDDPMLTRELEPWPPGEVAPPGRRRTAPDRYLDFPIQEKRGDTEPEGFDYDPGF